MNKCWPASITKYSFAQILSEFVRGTPLEEVRNKLTQSCTKKLLRQGMILLFFVSCVFFSSCSSNYGELEISATSPQGINQLEETSTPQTTLILPDSTNVQAETTPTIGAESFASVATEPIPSLLSPTLMPEATVTSIPTLSATSPSISFPGMVVASINIVKDEANNEIQELWLVDSRTHEKQLLFTGAPGAILTSLKWGIIHPDTLYVTEARGIGTGSLTWQLYEINFEVGTTSPIFTNFMEGLPSLMDVSFQGKWLRLLVEYPPSPDIGDVWFINVEDNTVIKSDDYYAGFVWSPNNPDLFAHSQNSQDIADENTPHSIMIRELPSQEIVDTIEYQHTNWGGEPFLLWHSELPDRIVVLILDQLFVVDLIQRNWSYVTGHLQFNPEDEFTISPSGKWLLILSRWGVKAIQLENIEEDAFVFEDRISQRHWFLSWYGNSDWVIILREDGNIVVYELGEEFELLEEFNLSEYGISPASSAGVVVKS